VAQITSTDNVFSAGDSIS